jgi:GNAT superfamily N-acetyltransferase
MTVRFDAAAARDLPQMVELLGTLFAQEAEFMPDAAKQEAAVKMIFADPKLGRFYVARDGAKVVAMACVLYTVSTAEGGRAGLFEDFVVRDDHRKQGIGTKLLDYVIGQARAEGLLRLTLLTDMQNERAQSLYRRLGFTGSPMKPMRLKIKPK